MMNTSEVEEFTQRIIDTGLFTSYKNRYNQHLLGTPFYFVWLGYSRAYKWVEAFESGPLNLINFETVFENCPDEVKEKLIFHLDLFSD